MILVDTALQARQAEGRPIRVAIVGAGFMCQGLANQIAHSVPGMRLVAISNRNIKRATDIFRYSGCENVAVAETQSRFDDAIRAGRAVATVGRHSRTEKTSS
jgi:predicted homoserine dehydrogenase-like protein